MSASKQLRTKFMRFDSTGDVIDHGIGKAKKVLKEMGGVVSKDGFIRLPPEIRTLPKQQYDEVFEAVEFLVEEWDFITVL